MYLKESTYINYFNEIVKSWHDDERLPKCYKDDITTEEVEATTCDDDIDSGGRGTSVAW